MEKIIFKIHSFIDVITNSSTELFMLDTDKSIDTVREIIKEMESKYPPEYGCYVGVDWADEWRIKEAFGYVNEEEAINYLKAKGYKIEVPKETNNEIYICISAERGGMHPLLHNFIFETFNVVYHTTEA